MPQHGQAAPANLGLVPADRHWRSVAHAAEAFTRQHRRRWRSRAVPF
jgi:hypothetical protein